jgi:hypothetical protein
MILYRHGRYTEAVAALEKAIALHHDPVDRARWRIFLAMSQSHLGQTPAAEECYQRARSELAGAKPASATADEFERLWAEANSSRQAADGNR